jgi:hypothetical protein
MDKTFFALLIRADRAILGYVIDAYPEERADYERQFAGEIVGEFVTRADAQAAVYDALQSAITPRELKH